MPSVACYFPIRKNTIRDFRTMLFRDISYYLDKAKENSSISSDRQLGAHLGYKGSMISFLRHGKNLPSPDKMIEIADLAGEDQEQALLDLCMWNTRGKAQEVYGSILQKISQVTVCLLIFAPTLSNLMQDFIYYGKYLVNQIRGHFKTAFYVIDLTHLKTSANTQP